jgi:hypothetical protein
LLDCAVCSIKENVTFVVKDEYAMEDLRTILQKAAVPMPEIYTVREVKGLEFKEVFVCDRDMTVNEKYVSYTRALAKLHEIHSMSNLADKTKTLILQGSDETED